MPRVKRAMIHLKKRRKLHKLAKGFKWRRSNLVKQTKVAVRRAGNNAFVDRRKRKRNFRQLWNIRINAGAREQGMSYSKLIGRLKKANIGLDRKVLAGLAATEQKIFTALLAKV